MPDSFAEIIPSAYNYGIADFIGIILPDHSPIKTPRDPKTAFFAAYAPDHVTLEGKVHVLMLDDEPGGTKRAMEEVVGRFAREGKVPIVVSLYDCMPSSSPGTGQLASDTEWPPFIIESDKRTPLATFLAEQLLDKLEVAIAMQASKGAALEQDSQKPIATVLLRWAEPVRDPDALSEIDKWPWARLFVPGGPNKAIFDAVAVAATDVTMRDPGMIANMLRKDARHFSLPLREELEALPVSDQQIRPAIA